MKVLGVFFSILMTLPAQAGIFPTVAKRTNVELHRNIIPGVFSRTGTKPLLELLPDDITHSLLSAGRTATIRGRTSGAGIKALKIENADGSKIDVVVTPYTRAGDRNRRKIVITTEKMDVERHAQIIALFRHNDGDTLKTIYSESANPNQILFEIDYGSAIYERQIELISRIIIARNEAHLSEVFKRISVQRTRPTTSR